MIQVEMAGQRVPPSIHLVPDDIRAITKELVEICVRGPNHIGGFAFGSLRNMKGWLASIGGDLDQPMRELYAYNSLLLFQFAQPFQSIVAPV